MNDEKENEIRKALKFGKHSLQEIALIEDIPVDQVQDIWTQMYDKACNYIFDEEGSNQ